jgi:hypothetical protein
MKVSKPRFFVLCFTLTLVIPAVLMIASTSRAQDEPTPVPAVAAFVSASRDDADFHKGEDARRDDTAHVRAERRDRAYTQSIRGVGKHNSNERSGRNRRVKSLMHQSAVAAPNKILGHINISGLCDGRYRIQIFHECLRI